MKEIWKEITSYEGYFEVSNLGNFKSKDRMVGSRWGKPRLYHGKSLKTETIEEGYTRITLMKKHVKKRFMCHRLVAIMFIKNPLNKPFVNHINGITNDNRACNLEWCTKEENEQHAVKILGKTMKGKTYPKRVKCIETDIEYPSMKKCIRALGNKACIEGLNKALRAGRKYHGYTFIRI